MEQTVMEQTVMEQTVMEQTTDIATSDVAEISEMVASRDNALPYRPGSLLAADHGVFTHYGIAGDQTIDGEQTVISCSWRTRVTTEESLALFANEQDIDDRGYIGDLAPHDILARARADLGRAWHLTRNNCEHHVTRACGLKPRSPQLRRATVGAVAIVALVCVPGLRVALLKGLASVA